MRKALLSSPVRCIRNCPACGRRKKFPVESDQNSDPWWAKDFCRLWHLRTIFCINSNGLRKKQQSTYHYRITEQDSWSRNCISIQDRHNFHRFRTDRYAGCPRHRLQTKNIWHFHFCHSTNRRRCCWPRSVRALIQSCYIIKGIKVKHCFSAIYF